MTIQAKNPLSELVSAIGEENIGPQALEAIAKLISDRYVRKELYKEKLAELQTLAESEATAKGQLEAARARENETNAKRALEEKGANPHFNGLLLKELGRIGLEAENLEENVASLKAAFPEAFCTIHTVAPRAANPPQERLIPPNPWHKNCPDIDEQTRLYRENPDTAKEMAGQMGVKLR